MRLAGKVALVTGGAHGIGRAIATGLAAEGAAVAVNYSRSGEAAAEAVAEIEDAGGRAIAVKADVSDRAACDRLVAETVDAFGTVDVLVNNAGISVEKPFLEVTEEEWDRLMAVNVKGVFLCTQRVLPIMLERGSGKIINLSSISAEVGDLETSAYCATKGAVAALTRQLALELGPHGINVNALGPGVIETAMNDDLLRNPASAREVVRSIPLGRLGAAADVAPAAVFLASEESDYLTGTTIYVDGGWLAR
jgi:NAD(P)-dependent dehydrogenase (short-subunit alcohol dehydrogenase family)